MHATSAKRTCVSRSLSHSASRHGQYSVSARTWVSCISRSVSSFGGWEAYAATCWMAVVGDVWNAEREEESSELCWLKPRAVRGFNFAMAELFAVAAESRGIHSWNGDDLLHSLPLFRRQFVYFTNDLIKQRSQRDRKCPISSMKFFKIVVSIFRFAFFSLPPPNKGLLCLLAYVFASTCLSVGRTTQEVVDDFRWFSLQGRMSPH